MKLLEKSTYMVLKGNYAVAYGVKLARVEVISAYPITPQTTIAEKLADMTATGELKARFITVESEHSAISAVIASSMAGARSFTATASQGLALMHEMLHWAVGARAPVVLANVNRALAPSWNIWTEQTDSLAQRDTGWIQIYNESNQEVLDSTILAFKIAERVYLPTMLVLDAFILSHTSEPVEVYPQELVDEFLPPYHHPNAINFDDPRAIGAFARPDYYMEFRYNIQKAHEEALKVFKEETELFADMFGRKYDTVEEFMLDDADYVLVLAGSTTTTAKYAVAKLRERGEKVGIMKIKLFRPFPVEDVRRVLAGRKKVAVIDRNVSFGHSGIFYMETKAAMYGAKDRPPIFGYVAGLGGRDIRPQDIIDIYEDMKRREEMDSNVIWKGVRV